MSDVVVVPWFSNKEWLETYWDAFSQDVKRWKNARDTMLVWQSRVEKLPAGVDVTIPLLQARIVAADPKMEKSVKACFLATALQRFVTSILKLPQTKYYRTQSMHNLAEEIGLPVHLVDLRNEIVHGHGGWAGGHTIQRALKTAYKWIKGYYWNAEFNRVQTETEIVPKIRRCRWVKFLGHVKRFAKCTKGSNKKRTPMYVKNKKILLKYLGSTYPLDPEQTTKAIVLHIFLPDADSCVAQFHNTVPACECGCCIDKTLLKRIKPVLHFFFSAEEGVNLLLSSLMKRGQTAEYSVMASDWIYIIAGTLLELPIFSSHLRPCPSHSLVIEKPPKSVDWKKVLMNLFALQSEWANHIANRIIESSKIGATESQRKNIEDLLSVCSGGSLDCYDKESKVNTHTEEDLYTIDSVVTTAESFLSVGEQRKLKRLLFDVTGSNSELESCDVPLGVLPHQHDDPFFYKELLVHYPDPDSDPDSGPPPPKKRKLQDSPS